MTSRPTTASDLGAIVARHQAAKFYDLRPRDPAKSTVDSVLVDWVDACVDRAALLGLLDEARSLLRDAAHDLWDDWGPEGPLAIRKRHLALLRLLEALP